MFDFITIMIVYIVSSVVRIITTLTRPFSEWLWNVLYFLIVGRTKKLPPINNIILLMTVQELAEKIRTGELRAEEVMAAYIQRCKAVNPMINAIMDERYEEAMKEAMAVDRLIASGTKSESEMAEDFPLLGVPFSCKESLGIKGLKLTRGMYGEKDNRAPVDAEAAYLFRKAGAIPMLVTNVPEFLMWWDTTNVIQGWTLNPYDNKRSVAGSSGGEAALITSCGSIMGMGDDMAGSVRLPASFCGIYAHKPSKGLISIKGWPLIMDPCDYMVSLGPLCRYVDDLPMLTKIMSGSNAMKVPFDIAVNFRKVRILYMEEMPGLLLSATNDIKAAVRRAVKHFEEEFGIHATKLDVPELQYSFYIWECKLLECGTPAFKDAFRPPITNITWEYIKGIFGAGKHTWPALYMAAIDRRSKNKFYHRCLEMFEDLRIKMEESLDGDTILIVPTHPDPPPHRLMTIPKYPNIAYTCVFNLLGYPCTQIPTGMSRGVPIGIQAVSTQFKDHLTLAAATELDKVFGGWMSPGPVAV